MKRLPFFILLIVLTISFFAFKNKLDIHRGNDDENKYEKVMRLVSKLLKEMHYSPQAVDDRFSMKVFNKYVNELDDDKSVFLKSDVDSLAKLYGTRIDDELNGAPVESFRAIAKVYSKRINEDAAITRQVLAKPFDYTVNETVVMDTGKLSYPANATERWERWRKKLKYYALQRYADFTDEREANKAKKGYEVKTDKQLEADARMKIDTLMSRMFVRINAKDTEDENFKTFVNVITTTMDPHTEYFPPADKRYFDEEMSGIFYGIGAALQPSDIGVRIASVNTGSPAEKSGKIKPGDIITKVAQDGGPAVDLLGFTVPDAVKLIRGKEGTSVTLTLRKVDNTVDTVKLKRERIENDVTFAKSAVITDPKNNTKIGIIDLPEFYSNFGNQEGGHRSYLDVAKEVEKLKAEHVDGIVLDLRNNPGGSLQEVVQMVGLFIGEGPVVQVKDRFGRSDVYKDDEKSVLYTGPLAVMVNEFSASASEIFAAAIQDYGRGIIIGSTSTYGKGTVQRSIGMTSDKREYTLGDDADLGSVKITLQKYYRINGGSVQKRGVESDVVLPNEMEHLKMRERDNQDALSYDIIAKANYTSWPANYTIKQLQAASDKRIMQDSAFKRITSNTSWFDKENDKAVSLNINQYNSDRKLLKEKGEEIRNAQKLKNKLDVSIPGAEIARIGADSSRIARLKLWTGVLSQDIYLNQAVDVVDDMIGIDKLARNK